MTKNWPRRAIPDNTQPQPQIPLLFGKLVRFHWTRFRATAHPTEDPEKVAEALAFVVGVDDQEIVRTELETHHGATQWLMEVELQKQRAIRDWLARAVGEHHEELLESLDRRLDDDGILYLRFDKQDAVLGQLRLAHVDDPISVRVKVEVHPFSREKALAAWQEYLEP